MGEKRLKIDTKIQPEKKKTKKKNKHGKRRSVVDNDDRISQLPDEILVDVLSLLSLKEAGRTSVLSSRWMNLWKHTHSLDFDGQCALRAISNESDTGNKKSLEEVESQYKLLKSEKRKYMKWVNSVVQSHKSPTVKQFRINYRLDSSDRCSINRWLEFAVSRQVQSLELDFPVPKYWSDCYCFPEELFSPSSSNKLSDFIKSLKELSFKNVDVSGGAIEFFLRNCPLLEKLIVRSPRKISKLEVCGPSLVLKHLEILCFSGLESLKVSSVPSLTSLTVMSLKGVLLENVPMLSVKCLSLPSNQLPTRRGCRCGRRNRLQ